MLNQRKIKFKKWVYEEIGGSRKLSIKLNVSQSSVQNWLAGRNVPSLKIAKRIISLSKEKLTLKDLT